MRQETGQTESEGISRALLIAYVMHLLVPFCLGLDVLLALSRRHTGRDYVDLLLFCGLWLAAGITAVLYCRDRPRFLKRIGGPLMGIYGILLSLGVIELGLRFIEPPSEPMLWKPRSRFVLRSNPGELPGISATSAFSVNELGLRGPSLPSGKGIYKIVTVGGSVTECSYLDDAKEWPHLLMEDLNAQQKSLPVWVANAGASGHTAVHHLMLLRSLPVLSRADLLIFLTGVNDLQATLSSRGASSQALLEQDAVAFRLERLSTETDAHPLFKRLRLFHVVKTVAVYASANSSRERAGRIGWFDHMRAKRAAGASVATPDLRAGTREYADRIQKIARECELRGLRCLFLTQPSMWREDLTPAEQKLQWFGWVGLRGSPSGYIAIADLARAMDAYNGALETVCSQRKLECLDLAPLVPKNTSAFMDDVHLNENGARIVAEILARYLVSTAPFSSTSARSGPGAAAASDRH